MNILPWKHNSEEPVDRTLSLVILNGKIAADVFVWFEKRGIFITHSLFKDKVVENKIKLSEVDAWIGIGDLPVAPWAPGRA